MTPELDRADRAAAVRAAARSWRRAGIIDDAALTAVESGFPDDRVRAGPVFRVLLFLFTVVAVSGVLGFLAAVGLGGHNQALAALAAVAGVALLALTEFQVGALRRRQGGTEAATSLMGIGLLLAAAAWFLLEARSMEAAAGVPALCALAAMLTGAAAWRWGYPLYAALGTAAALVALAHLPAGRAVWIALALAAAPALLRLSESPRLPPAHRSSAMAVLLVALGGLYLAVHVGSWDERIVERIGGRDPGPAPPALLSPLSPPSPHDSVLWWLATAATALVPVLLLTAGLRRRRLPLLLAGTVAAVASLATFEHYLRLEPAWLVLTGGGALWIAVVLGLWRYLDSGPAGERGGFTAAPLLTDARRQAALEVGVAILTLQPETRAAGDEHPFEGGGGRSGGAGATGDF